MVYYVHYCGPEVVSVNMYSESDGCEDGGCGDESEEPDDCCKDEVVTAKVTQDHNTIDAFKLKLVNYADVILPVTYQYEECAAGAVHYTTKVHKANAPPGLWQSLPLYKLHSSFTYYG